MNHIPEPLDPVIRMEVRRDPQLAELWAEFCATQASQGFDPNRPPPFVRPFREFANHRMQPFIDVAGKHQYAAWKTAARGELATRAGERRVVAERVRQWWSEAIDLLDQLLSVAEEFGMVHAHRWEATPATFPQIYPLLIDLHSRGVQVAEEILALLKTGFAAGAEARWRTLHEIAVVAAFIARHGGDIAERYTEHDRVRVKKAMQVEQEHHKALGLEPYTVEEMKEARETVGQLKEKYGSSFLGDYGWAAAALGRDPNGTPPTFVDIEASLNMRFFRAAYRSASEAIHAGPGALVDNPGKLQGATPYFLTRGTAVGLLEPGIRTAGSISLLSHALMEWRPFPFDRIALVAMGLMVKDVAEHFWASERRLGEELARVTSEKK